jgi:hypothetical protein
VLFENAVELGVVLREGGKTEDQVVGDSKMREVMKRKTFPCFVHGDFVVGLSVVSGHHPIQGGEKGRGEVLWGEESLQLPLLLLLLGQWWWRLFLILFFFFFLLLLVVVVELVF